MALKSLLLTPVLTLLSILALWSLVQIAGGGSFLLWLGVFLAAVPLPGFVSLLMLRQATARTTAELPALRWLSVAGAALAVLAYMPSGGSVWPAIAAVVSVGAFVWYEFHYSDLSRQPSGVIAMGRPLPAFALERPDGTTVDTGSFAGRPTLFLFYRGNWCPLCMAQVKEIAAAYQRLDAAGVRVALVSPQPHGHTAGLAEKFDVPMEFYVDPDGRAAEALEIAAPDGVPLGLTLFGYAKDTVLPTVVATDAAGTVIFLDQTDNYRVRPEPETFLAIFA
ncbi:MAG: redoxin domain-containing protein [Pseudomonadota bacterium]